MERKTVFGSDGALPFRFRRRACAALCEWVCAAGCASLRFVWPRRWILRAGVLIVVVPWVLWFCFLLAARLTPFPEDLLASVSLSPVVFSSEGEVLRIFPNPEGNYMLPVSLDEVSPHVIAATLAVEDRRFWSHGGVDLLALLRACFQNLTSFRIVSGASTITQQVVRLLQPRPRTVWSKIVEAFRAIQLENRLSKKDILTLYLTCAPYGGNLYGIEAASLAYFGKRAHSLSIAEAALLAGLPQAPSRLRPDRNPGAALRRRNLVLRAMVREGSLAEEKAQALSHKETEAPGGGHMPRCFTRHPFPCTAPHLCRFLRFMRPGATIIRSTVWARLQKRVESLLRKQVQSLSGVENAACIVLENATGAVRAYVGSTDFWDTSHAGQVDGVRSWRSPGSTLKPFLYACLYDRGLLAPEEVVPDVPLGALRWQPENFDRGCHGLVAARAALSRSYNLSAVRLLARLGVESFLRFLKKAGLVRSNSSPYGLSLILGAAEVRLVDLVRAYSALARFGTPVPLLFTKGEELSAPVPFRAKERRGRLSSPVFLGEERSSFSFSPAACFLVAEALTRAPTFVKQPLGYAWKTGTSWGRRDAWTCAYTPRFTVGVWVGNFSGRPSPNLVGQEAASPVALEILSALDPQPAWPRTPRQIVSGRVCAETGLRAGKFCPHVVTARVLSQDRRKCPVHRRFPVDAATGKLLCRFCLKQRQVAWRVFSLWPPDVEAYLEARGKAPLPGHEPSCAAVRSGPKPRFLSPQGGAKYVLTERVLPVEVFAPARSVTLFLDGALLPERRVRFTLPLTPGWHSLSCLTETGQSDQVSFLCLRR